jgi:hypothetical protein
MTGRPQDCLTELRDARELMRYFQQWQYDAQARGQPVVAAELEPIIAATQALTKSALNKARALYAPPPAVKTKKK